MLNLLTLILYTFPLVWLCLRRKVRPIVFSTVAQISYVIICLTLAVLSQITYRSLTIMLASAYPYLYCSTIMEPMFVGPNIHNALSLYLILLPLCFFLCPFIVLLPFFLNSYVKSRLITVLQFVVVFLFLGVSGLALMTSSMD